jgi:tetratricopeptide (TPR) repeat protein
MKPSTNLYHQGIIKYNSGDFKGAIAYFNHELENRTLTPDIYVYRGRARYHLGDKDGALEDWIKAIELGAGYVHELIEKHFG